MKVLRHLITATAAVLALAAVEPTTANAQIGAEIVITAAPPARKVEVQYPSPGANYAWHRGDWVYNPEIGSYVWHAGHWVIHPDATHTVWAPGDWVFPGQLALRPRTLAHRGRGARAGADQARRGREAAPGPPGRVRSGRHRRLFLGPRTLGLGRGRLPLGRRPLAPQPESSTITGSRATGI